ncbi:MAG: sensor histidine kinase [Lachnospirales bacterium]|nr:Probable sensor-like histidine kinase YehU [uncultured Clostridium sp.]
MGKHETSIYRKVVITFTVILLGVLILVGAVINRFCMSFIKEQRITYNTQVLGEVEYEFKELYMQMNQILTSLCEINYTVPLDESVFQEIKADVEFEDSIQNMVYLNGFNNFYEGVLFYDCDEEIHYVGTGPVAEGYSFSEDKWFSGITAGMSYCAVVGPMPEQYKPEHVQKNRVIGFIKRKPGKAKEGGLPPFVMFSVKFSKIEEMLDKLLSTNTGFFLMDQNGTVLDSANLSNLNWSDETLMLAKKKILKDQEHTQTISKEGILLTSIQLNQYGWILSVADSEEILFKDINRLTRMVELLIGIVGSLGVLAAVFFSRKILFPIELLKNMVNEIGKDDKTYLKEISGDEVGEVRALLNSMKKRIHDLNANQYILEVREREAEIRMLQSQINPHFLHNTLDNIYCIAQIEDIEPIEILTKSLSEMMRYSVNNKNMYATLTEEMNHVKAYVEIINIRYEECICLKFEVKEELQKTRVVKLLLQPLVENACIHGILQKPEQRGNIWIKVRQEETRLEIRVEDDGVGVTEELCESLNKIMQEKVRSIRTPKNNGFGIALVNVNDRIRLLDGPEYGIRMVKRPEGGTCVIVTQKYRTEIPEEDTEKLST